MYDDDDVMSGGDGEIRELISDASSSDMNGENCELSAPPFEPFCFLFLFLTTIFSYKLIR